MDRRSQSRPPSVVVVTINQPEVEHRVRIKDFENWLDSAGKSLAEMALKSRLRDIIGNFPPRSARK